MLNPIYCEQTRPSCNEGRVYCVKSFSIKKISFTEFTPFWQTRPPSNAMASGSQHNTMRAISHGMARSLSVSAPTSSATLAVLRGRNPAGQRLPNDYVAFQREGTNLIDDAGALPDQPFWRPVESLQVELIRSWWRRISSECRHSSSFPPPRELQNRGTRGRSGALNNRPGRADHRSLQRDSTELRHSQPNCEAVASPSPGQRPPFQGSDRC